MLTQSVKALSDQRDQVGNDILKRRSPLDGKHNSSIKKHPAAGQGMISPSKKIISLALKNGWEEKDLIKICLPKWDKFDELKNIKGNNNKSIFIFFTWRIWKQNISIIL